MKALVEGSLQSLPSGTKRPRDPQSADRDLSISPQKPTSEEHSSEKTKPGATMEALLNVLSLSSFPVLHTMYSLLF